MRITGVCVVVLAAVGCFSPRIVDGGFICDPSEPQPCPDGYSCRAEGDSFVCTTRLAAPGGGGDGGVGGGGGTDLATGGDVVADMAHSSGGGSVDMATPPSGCGEADLLINEVETGGSSATDEWVEIYNPCTAAVSFTGKLVYRGPSSVSDSSTLATLSGKSISGGGFFLVANVYSGTADIKPFDGGGIGASGGGVALRDGSNKLLSSLAWGSGTSNGFGQGSPAPVETSGKTISRKPNGTNTHDDSSDFVSAAPTPRAAN